MSELAPVRDIEAIVLPRVGSAKRDAEDPLGVNFKDASGSRVPAVDLYLRNLLVDGNDTATCYSYAQDLLRWWRFLSAIGVTWDHATRTEYSDYILWMRRTPPKRGGDWRRTSESAPKEQSNRASSPGFAPRTIAHAAAVLASFYSFHETADGPISPVPPAGRPHAHHTPGTPFRRAGRRSGRQKIPVTMPKSLTDDQVTALIQSLSHVRDLAIVEFFVSSGARASELLGLRGSDVDWGRQRIRVIRKGTHVEQWLPASPDAFVLLGRYRGTSPLPDDEPVWRTLRGEPRALTYHAFRAALNRAQAGNGTHHTMHQFRHTAAHDFANNSDMSLPQVKHLLGHAFLTTTQIYTEPRDEEVLQAAADHLRRKKEPTITPKPSLGYSDASLRNLFGGKP